MGQGEGLAGRGVSVPVRNGHRLPGEVATRRVVVAASSLLYARLQHRARPSRSGENPTGREATRTPESAPVMTSRSQRAQEGTLWGGRFERGMAPEMVPLNLSLDVDSRLWPQDIRGSQAWARALAEAQVISADEAERLVQGLRQVARRLENGEADGAPDEDIHSLVERLLYEEAGEVAGKLHSGRSRNDQVATDFRLWGLDAGRGIEGWIGDLAEALLSLAERSVDLIMPGYTHLQ